ncbi:MAG: hypothetical protein WAX07_04435 [Candidatus Altiarchaeia archaeon]
MDYIRLTLERIGSSLPSPVTTYHIGGNAMCWYGLKDTTKDTDLVFIEDVELFETALISGGFLRTDEQVKYKIGEPYARYSEIKNTPLDKPFIPGLDIDLFFKDICGKITFSQGMVSRSAIIWESGNLMNRICSKEDIFIFKAVAGRPDDVVDMRSLAESGLNWDSVADEYISQLSRLRRPIVLEISEIFTQSISNLREDSKISLPNSFTKKIARINK